MTQFFTKFDNHDIGNTSIDRIVSLPVYLSSIDTKRRCTIMGIAARHRKGAAVRIFFQTLSKCVESDIFCFAGKSDPWLAAFKLCKQS